MCDLIAGIGALSMKDFALSERDSDFNWPYLFQVKEKPNQLERV